MKQRLSSLFKVGALVAAAAAAIRGLRWFRGSPEGVGDESFAFDVDAEDPFDVDEAKLGGDVSPDLLERLVCPLDKGPLEVIDGKWLLNPRNGFRYPIVDGIPVMLVEVGERYREAAEGNGNSAAGEPRD